MVEKINLLSPLVLELLEGAAEPQWDCLKEELVVYPDPVVAQCYGKLCLNSIK
jgi:hypothetical protein